MRNEKLRKVLTLHAYDLICEHGGSFNVSTGGHIREHHNTLTNISTPRKFRSPSSTGGTRWYCVLYIFEIWSLCMFLRSRSPLPTFLLSYHIWVTSKIQVNFRFNRYSKVLMIVSYRFSQFLHYLCFRSQRIHF